MAITLKFRGGPLAGQTFSFGDEVDRITIGRDEKCQVPIPSEWTRVGRQHMALRQELGRYRLVLNRDNPVTVDGRSALDGMELPSTAQIELGKDGPTLVAVTQVAGNQPETVRAKQAAPGLRTRLESAETGTRRTRRILAGVAGAVVVLGVVGFLLLRGTEEKLEGTSAEIEKALSIVTRVEGEQAAVKASLDTEVASLKSVAEKQEQARRDLESRVAEQGKALGAVTPSVAALLEKTQLSEEKLKEIERKVTEQRDAFERVFQKAKESVLAVILRHPNGAEERGATAWVVGDGVLATNAHVAKQLEDTKPGQRLAGYDLLVRTPTPNVRDFKVKRVVVHPGFDVLGDVVIPEVLPTEIERKTVVDPEGKPTGDYATLLVHPDFPGSCDVGLLYVEDPTGLPPPLPIAGSDVLSKLGRGSLVGYVGYPTEGMTGGGFSAKAPVATTQIAHVTAVTNYLLAEAEFEDALLVQNSLPSAGGASGSPILDVEGRVVSLIYAGQVQGVGFGGARVGHTVMVNFGQRADLVTELLEGKADEAQARRIQRWREQVKILTSFEQALAQYRPFRLEDARQGLKRVLSAQAPAQVLVDRVYTLGPNATAPGEGRTDVPIDLTAGAYLCFAWIPDAERTRAHRDLNLGLTLSQNQVDSQGQPVPPVSNTDLGVVPSVSTDKRFLRGRATLIVMASKPGTKVHVRVERWGRS